MQFHNGADTELTPYSCETCGQKYTRLDHLTRHIRSHTQERPFACEACGKAFARADLLKRHALGHEGDGLSKRQKTAASTRPRAARACIACARSKLRCDGVEPCSRCSKKNVACCYKNGGPINSVLRPSQVDLGQVNEVGRLDSPQTSVILQNISSGVHWRDLPTPVEPVEFVEEQGENQPSVEATTGSNIDFDDAYLADFLRDILNPTAQQLQQHGAANFEAQFAAKDFLDFTLPSSLEYIGDAFQMYQEDAPGAPIGHQVDANTKDPPAPSAGRSGYATPTGRNTGGLFLSAQAFSESLWLWTPQQGDHNKADRADLSLPVDALVSREKEGLGATPFPALEQRARDQVLATVLDICDRAMASVVVSCFPSAELLTILIHKFMVHHSSLTDNWCHFAQFDPNKEVPEMVICMASAGAALSKSPRLRRLGYAFQEAARTLNGLTFEADNRNIRKLKPIQCLTLLLDVGVWSGDRRKVEIAESFSQCLVNMVRRGGYFERIEDNTILPTLEDDQATLEMKWSTWIEKESFRRLVAHLLIRDNQTSASSLIPPLISYAEVSCALPMPRALWDAKTANDWAQLMRTTLPADAWGERVISVRSCLRDLPPAAACRRIDVDLTILIISHAIWGVCWQHRQIEAILRQDGDDMQKTGGFMSSSIEQIASQKVQQFRVEASEWSAFSSDATLACERILMNLYVSLEDVQLLAGKRGEKEARRTLSTLKHWAQSSASRQAVWHAGQVVRAASEYPPGTLREASAIAVYHAGLIFWAYAILVNASKPGPGNDIQASGQEVILNGESTPHLERFVMLGRGVPVLRIYTNTARIGHLVPVTEAKKVMGFMTELLQANNENRRDEPPPLVDNLNKLMRSLGNAARGIRD